MSEKEEPRIFKLWKCPFCADQFVYWVTPAQEEKNAFPCPNCYSDVVISKKKLV